jgi:hypothetical protein
MSHDSEWYDRNWVVYLVLAFVISPFVVLPLLPLALKPGKLQSQTAQAVQPQAMAAKDPRGQTKEEFDKILALEDTRLFIYLQDLAKKISLQGTRLDHYKAIVSSGDSQRVVRLFTLLHIQVEEEIGPKASRTSRQKAQYQTFVAIEEKYEQLRSFNADEPHALRRMQQLQQEITELLRREQTRL